VNLSLPLFSPSSDALNDASNDAPNHRPVPHGLAGLVACAPVERAIERATRLTVLHPGLWRASQIGGAPGRITASGFDALDAELPGGGWPHGVLTELLLPQPGVGELRLLAPALAAVAPLDAGGQGAASRAASLALLNSGRRALSDPGRCVMLFDPPASLSAWALLQCGLDSRHWLVVQSRAGQGPAPSPVPLGRPAPGLQQGVPRSANRLAPLLPGADLLWALEQSLKSGHVGAILAWLPLKLGADALRRLQIAAQAQDGPVFVFRAAQARSQPSPAPLRLLLQAAGVDGLSLRLLKRRGPSLAQPLRLTLPSALTPRQQAQARDLSLQAVAAQAAPDAGRARTLAGSRLEPVDSPGESSGGSDG